MASRSCCSIQKTSTYFLPGHFSSHHSVAAAAWLALQGGFLKVAAVVECIYVTLSYIILKPTLIWEEFICVTIIVNFVV